MLVDDVHCRGALERFLARQHFVEDYSETVYVGAPVHGLDPGLLRSKVVRRSDDGTVHRNIGLSLKILGNTVIRHHRRAIRAKENVAGFDVAVYDALFVRDLQCFTDGRENFQGLFGSHPGCDARLQITAFHILHGNIDVARVDTDVVHRNDIAVTQRGEDAALVQETLGPLLGFGILQYLQSDRALQGFLGGAKHDRHATRTDVRLDLITGDVQLCHGICCVGSEELSVSTREIVANSLTPSQA